MVEVASEGTDSVSTRVSYTLADGVEVEWLLAASAAGLTLTGNAFSNGLLGNVGRNILRGGGGRDRLDGRAGDDSLAGQAGADRFTFRPGAGDDRVFGFTDTGGTEDDQIDLRACDFDRPADVGTASAGDDLILNMGEGDSVRIVGYLRDGRPATDIFGDLLV